MITAATVRDAWFIGKHLTDEVKKHSLEQPPSLHHYTDAQGLLGIVKSRTLWATDYRYLNDSSEFLYARSLIEDVVAEANKEAPPGSVKAVLRDTVLSGLDKNSIGDQTNVQFLVCFSESRDQLSQWRGYGKGIGGYSLGFDFAQVKNLQEEINRTQWHGKLGTGWQVSAELVRCWYKKNKQTQLVSESIKMLSSRAEDNVRKEAERTKRNIKDLRDFPDRVEATEKYFAFVVRSMSRRLSAAFKDPAFEDESEWRLVLSFSKPPKERESIEEEIPIEFRKGQFTIIPYVVVMLDAEQRLDINDLVIGPTPLREIAKQAAMGLLRGVLSEDKICCSDVPFRHV